MIEEKNSFIKSNHQIDRTKAVFFVPNFPRTKMKSLSNEWKD